MWYWNGVVTMQYWNGNTSWCVCVPTMSSMMGMICSWRERGNPSPSQTVAFNFCTREDNSTGLPIAAMW